LETFARARVAVNVSSVRAVCAGPIMRVMLTLVSARTYSEVLPPVLEPVFDPDGFIPRHVMSPRYIA
jgi:hypothetical protein